MIVYAPSSRDFDEQFVRNAAISFDVLVLETLLEVKGKSELCFLGENATIREIFKDKLSFVEQLPREASCLVSDASSIVFEFSLARKIPSIMCYLGFCDVEYPDDDRYFDMLRKVTHNVFTLAELKAAIENFSEICAQKRSEIESISKRTAI